MKHIFGLIILFSLSLCCFAQPKPLRSVEPLLNTVRVQSAPFNNSCPYYNYGDSISSERCLVGCVATSIEQLLSYYRYPERLQDSIAGWETKNYSLATVPAGSVIDWEDVADLSLWCGMIVQMKYGVDASASGLWKAEEPLRRVFGYKMLKVLDRSMYSFDAWHRILQNELMAGRPVAYVGYTNLMNGHAFNIDGVDENGLYHCNWGEGEGYDGYYSLEHLCKYQPWWDETEWGRMMGFSANEYMLVLHPDSVEDFLELDTLKDFAHAVKVENIEFKTPVYNSGHVLTDVTLTNTTADTLFHAYEIIINSPSDTSLLEQCKEVALSSVKLMPYETHTQTIVGKYHVPIGEKVVSLTFDGVEVPYSKSVQVVGTEVDKLSFQNIAIEFPEDSTAHISLRMHNSASSGAYGRLLYCRLYPQGSDVSVSMDYRITSVPAGQSRIDTLYFHRLEPGVTYNLHIGGWSSTMHQLSFTMPDSSTYIETTPGGAHLVKHTPLYDIKGRTVLRPENGIYIKNGKKVYYESRRNN